MYWEGHITKDKDIVSDILQKIRILGGTYYKIYGYCEGHITKDKDIGWDILQKIRILGG